MEVNLTPKELSTLIGDIYQASKSGNWVIPLTKIRQATACYSASLRSSEYIFESKSPFNHVLNKTEKTDQSSWSGSSLNYCPLTKYQYFPVSSSISSLLDKLSPSHFVSIPRSFSIGYNQIKKNIQEKAQLHIIKPKSYGEFLTADNNLLNLLSPHFERAIDIQKKLLGCETTNNLSQSVFNTAEILIVICGFNGNVLFLPDITKNYLRNNQSLYIKNHQVTINNPFYNKQLKQIINKSINFIGKQKGGRDYLIIDDKTVANTLLVISPLSVQEDKNSLNHPYCLITIHSQENIDWQGLKNTFELTPKELGVLKAVSQNQKLANLSTELGVSYNTVRTHLQSIFKKTNVCSQVELILKTMLFKKINIKR